MRTIASEGEHLVALEIGCAESQHTNFGTTVIAPETAELAHIESGRDHSVDNKMVPGYAVEGRVGPFRIVLRVMS